MFCPKCGNEVSEETVYCGICGQKLDTDLPSGSAGAQVETVSTPLSPKMFCPKCGSPIFDENPACPSCGWQAEPPKSSAAPTAHAKSQILAAIMADRKFKWLLLAFGIFVATVLLVCAIVVGSAEVVGEWESEYGDTIEFYENGTCDIDDYILSLVSGTLVNGADDLMYDTKFGGKIEISYTTGSSVRSVEINYKLDGDILTLGNMTFEREP